MKGRSLTILLIPGLLIFCMFSRSCANTTTPPGGGPKDTIPPVLVKVTPPSGATNFPVTGGKIAVQFDEYTVIKTAQDIFLSPPTKKRPQSKVKGKSETIFGCSFKGAVEYRINANFVIGSALSYSYSDDYSPLTGMLYLRYYIFFKRRH